MLRKEQIPEKGNEEPPIVASFVDPDVALERGLMGVDDERREGYRDWPLPLCATPGTNTHTG
jgi:hypothetical protein